MNIEVYHYAEQERVNRRLISYCSRAVLNEQRWALLPYSGESGEHEVPELSEVMDFFASKLPRPVLVSFSWLNVAWRGGGFANHRHESDFVGAYHVMGDGDLILDLGARAHRVPARPGQLVIFPGRLFHAIPRVLSERRISIGIDGWMQV